MNSVGCIEAETPEDLKSAFKIVSGSTSAGEFEEVLALDRRGSPSFFTEGVSLNRLEDLKKKFKRQYLTSLYDKYILTLCLHFMLSVFPPY